MYRATIHGLYMYIHVDVESTAWRVDNAAVVDMFRKYYSRKLTQILLVYLQEWKSTCAMHSINLI